MGSQGLDMRETRTGEQEECHFHLAIRICGPETPDPVPHICGKLMVVFPRDGRRGKFKSWVTLKVMKKASAWVFHNMTFAGVFSGGLKKEGTTSISPREVDNKAGQGLQAPEKQIEFYLGGKFPADNWSV